MRITQLSLYQQQMYENRKQYANLAESQLGSTTGTRVNTAEDDPNNAAQLVRLATDKERSKQYQRNIQDGLDRLQTTDNALSRIDQILTSARAKAVSGGTDSITDDDRQKIATDLDQILNDLVATVNQQSDGRYLFGGATNDKPPLQITKADDGTITQITMNWEEIATPVLRDIGDGEEVSVTASPLMFRSDDSGTAPDVFTELIRLRDDLRGNGTTTQVTTHLDAIDKYRAKVNGTQAQVGEWVNQLNAADIRWKDRDLRITDQTSKLQDWDTAEIIMKYKQAETSYSSSLQMTSQIFNLSLLKYLS